MEGVFRGIEASMAKSIKLRCTMKVNKIQYHLPLKCKANTDFFFQKTIPLKMPEVGTVYQKSFEWKILNFLNLDLNQGKSIESPPFILIGKDNTY